MFIENTEIFYKTNFLTNDELDFFDFKISENKANLIEIINFQKNKYSYSEKNKPIAIVDTARDIKMIFNKAETKVMESLAKKIKNLIVENMPSATSNIFVPLFEIIHCIYPPFYLHDHYDSSTSKSIKYAAVVYLTDPKEYDSGEITYVNKNISFKPERGSIIVHPSSKEYLHKVEQVTSGIRMTMNAFVYKKNLI